LGSDQFESWKLTASWTIHCEAVLLTRFRSWLALIAVSVRARLLLALASERASAV